MSSMSPLHTEVQMNALMSSEFTAKSVQSTSIEISRENSNRAIDPKIEKALSAVSDGLAHLSTTERQQFWRNYLKRGPGWRISDTDPATIDKIVISMSNVNLEQDFRDFIRDREKKKKAYYFLLSYLALGGLIFSVIWNIVSSHYGGNNPVFLYISIAMAALVRVGSIALGAVIPADEVDFFDILMEEEYVFMKIFFIILVSTGISIIPYLSIPSTYANWNYYVNYAIVIPQSTSFLWAIREHFIVSHDIRYFRFVGRIKILFLSVPIILCFNNQKLIIKNTPLSLPVLWLKTVLYIVWFIVMVVIVVFQYSKRRKQNEDNYVDYRRHHAGMKEFNSLLVAVCLGSACYYVGGISYNIGQGPKPFHIGQQQFMFPEYAVIVCFALAIVFDVVPLVIVYAMGFKKTFDLVIKYLPSWLNFDNNIEALYNDGVFMSVLVLSCHVHNDCVWLYNNGVQRKQYHLENMPGHVDRTFWVKGNKTKMNFDGEIDDKDTYAELSYVEDMNVNWQVTFHDMDMVTIRDSDKTASKSETKSSFPSFEDWIGHVTDPSACYIDRNKKCVVVKLTKKDVIKTKERLEEKKVELRNLNILRKYTWNAMHFSKESTQQLMTKSPREMGDEKDRKKIYNLSEQIGRVTSEKDKIDFFISHSWSDDGEEKSKTLEKFSEDFKEKHGRYPTFWFDKVCIDQTNSEMGIATLPINLNACKGVLILMGSTYLQRLWCLWELFTLFTFRNKEHARSLVVIKRVNGGGLQQQREMESWKNFDINNAHCFDPNEELKLRYLMLDLIGKDKVTEGIQGILDTIDDDVILH